MKWIVLMVGLLLASPAFAAKCTDGATWGNARCDLLCDGVAAADPDLCGPVRIYQFESVAIELARNDDCSAAGTATIYTRSEDSAFGTGGKPWHSVGVLNLDATDTTGTSILLIDGQAAPLLPYLYAVLATDTDCSNITIKVHQR
tara:strand:+ start:5834 stop:6268 length:435 start_codon:yes stop_codon:yes gene_type:complete